MKQPRAHRPRLTLAVVAVVVSALVATLAVIDHRRVKRRSHRADVASWFCERRGTRCNELQPGALESRWEVRERSYEALFGFAVVLGGSAGISAVRRRR